MLWNWIKVPLLNMQQNQSTDTKLWWRKAQNLFPQGFKQGVYGQLMLRRLPDGIQGSIFKCERKDRRACDELMHNSLTGCSWGIRVMFWESQSSAFQFQLV